MKKKSTIDLNLIPNTDWLSVSIQKFTRWALTIGRAIVFFTFFIVVVAFLYRFYIDRKIENASEKVTKKTQDLKEQSGLEESIRLFQSRLNFIESIDSQSIPALDIISAIELNIPKKGELSQIEISNTKVVFEGKVGNEVLFVDFVIALQKNPLFSEVIVENLRYGGVNNPQVDFQMSLNLNTKNQK